MAQLVQAHPSATFDVFAVFDWRKNSLSAGLAAMHAPAADSPRALLRNLHGRNKPTLAEARELCRRLAERPGKGYWATLELLRALLQHRLLAEAYPLADRLAAERPTAFATHLALLVCEGQKSDRNAVADKFVASLDFAHTSGDRLHRIGAVFDQWRATEALGKLLDGWHRQQPGAAKDPAFFFLAFRFYKMRGNAPLANTCLALALQHEPLAREHLEARWAQLLRLGTRAEADEIATIVQAQKDEAQTEATPPAPASNRAAPDQASKTQAPRPPAAA
jgi:hypothetical protein